MRKLGPNALSCHQLSEKADTSLGVSLYVSVICGSFSDPGTTTIISQGMCDNLWIQFRRVRWGHPIRWGHPAFCSRPAPIFARYRYLHSTEDSKLTVPTQNCHFSPSVYCLINTFTPSKKLQPPRLWRRPATTWRIFDMMFTYYNSK